MQVNFHKKNWLKYCVWIFLQDLQSDVFGGGGGASKKYWKMYEGSTSFDSLDDTDVEQEELLRDHP